MNIKTAVNSLQHSIQCAVRSVECAVRIAKCVDEYPVEPHERLPESDVEQGVQVVPDALMQCNAKQYN
jgi:hypothetical protein